MPTSLLERIIDRVPFSVLVALVMGGIFVLMTGCGFDHPGWLGWDFGELVILGFLELLLAPVLIVSIIADVTRGP